MPGMEGTGCMVLEIVQTVPDFSGKKEEKKNEVVKSIEFEIALNFVSMAILTFHQEGRNR
jgi:hypothetical protein